MNEVKKRGRPVKSNAKSKQYRLRMSSEESKMLDEMSVYTGLDKSEILRRAMKMYYNLSKYQK